MATTYWTLAVGGVEKQLADWGVMIDFAVSKKNKGKPTATLTTTERFDLGAEQWQFLAHATIYRDRVSGSGAPNSFGNTPANGGTGSIYFQGYFDDPRRSTDQGQEHIYYQLHGVQWLFELIQFKQQRNQFLGFDHTHQRVQTASPFVLGTGYKVGDVIPVPGGTFTSQAQATVGAVGPGGNVLFCAISNGGGLYSVAPASPTPPIASATGTGLRLSLGMGQAVTTQKFPSPEVFLGEKLDSTNPFVAKQNNGDQVKEILQWVNEVMNPTRKGTGGNDASQDVLVVGTIDPHVFMPTTRQNTVYCEGAIRDCLRLSPDAVVYEDPTTVIPTVHVRTLGKWNYATTPPTFIDYTNISEIVETITADQEREILSQSQNSRTLSGVIIQYKIVNTIDGTMQVQFVVDKADANGAAQYINGVLVSQHGGLPTVSDYDPFVSSHVVDLQGVSSTNVRANIITTPISQLLSAVASDVVAWWKAHDKTLGDTSIDPSSILIDPASIQVLDDNGVAVDTSTLTGELVNCSLPGWATTLLGYTGKRARVSANITFDHYTDPTLKTVKDFIAAGRLHTQTIALTNAPSGTLTALATFTPGEAVPQNVAESVFRAMSATQFAGRVTFKSSPLRSDITLGTRLKLVGPNTTFSNLLVQQIDEVPLLGSTTVTFGPADPASVDMLVELARATRLRLTYNMPSGRGDGLAVTGATVDTGNNIGENNTSHGVGKTKRYMATAPHTGF